MATQSLKKFQSVFSMEAVRVEYGEFTKDGAFSKETVKALKDEGLDAIYLKPLSSAARVELDLSVVSADGKKRDAHNVYARFVAPCWCDKDGKLMGTAQEVGQLRTDLISAIFFKVQELNGAKTGAVEEAGKD